jgi:large subunit ribosomal protein L13
MEPGCVGTPGKLEEQSMNTLALRPEDLDTARQWFQVDAAGKTVGRLASEIAKVLIGKHKPTYSLNQDAGDFVVVVNADKVRFTGKKLTDKIYRHHSYYPGGLKSTQAKDVLAKHPTRVLELAVRGMLPKNRLRDIRMTRFKIYALPNHPHSAQQPKQLPI